MSLERVSSFEKTDARSSFSTLTRITLLSALAFTNDTYRQDDVEITSVVENAENKADLEISAYRRVLEKKLQEILPPELSKGYFEDEKQLMRVIEYLYDNKPELLVDLLEHTHQRVHKLPFKFKADNLKNEPWAEGFFEKFVVVGDRNSINIALKLEGADCFERILKLSVFATAEKTPSYLFSMNSTYKLIDGVEVYDIPDEDKYIANLDYYPEAIRIAAYSAAKNTPPYALKYHRFFKGEDYYAEVCELAARNGIEYDPGTSLRYIGVTETQDYYPAVLRTTFFKAAEFDPGHALENIHLIDGKEYYEEILRLIIDSASDKAPHIIMHFFKYFSHLPDAKNIARKVVENDPEHFVNHYHIPEFKNVEEKEDFELYESDGYAGVEVIKNVLGGEAKPLYKRLKKRIERLKQWHDLPEKMVQREDLPISKERLNNWIMATNYVVEGVTRKSGFERQYISIPKGGFTDIVLSPVFQSFLQSRSGKISYAQVFSYAHVIYRKLDQIEEPLKNEFIEMALKEIRESEESAKNREIFGPNTKLVLFTHQETRYSNREWLENVYYRSGGRPENILYEGKGERIQEGKNEVKKSVLKAIQDSHGDLTVVFNGHGNKFHWALSGDQLDSFIDSKNTINYEELGDALIASGNIENINLLGTSCFAYDYLINLFAYFESKGETQKPRISISGANKDRLNRGFGEHVDPLIMDQIYGIKSDNEPIRVEDFVSIQSAVWEYQDPAIFVGGLEIQ